MFKITTKPLIVILSICCHVFAIKASHIDTTASLQIIEKAILLAPEHDKATANYSAEVIIQNQGTWNRIPSIWRGFLKKEGVEDSLVYQSESYANFQVDNNNSYLFEYKAVRNNYHAEPRADKYVNPNFYKAIVGPDAISPLSEKALYFYTFEYLGTGISGKTPVYRFKVTPKHHNDEKVFSGIIAISTQGYWLAEVDLAVRHYAIQYQIHVNYESVDGVYLPTNYKIDVSGKLMGFVGKYHYLAKVWNYKLGLNTPIVRPQENEFREVYNIQERNFEVQQFKQVMGTLATNLQNIWSDANIASGLKRYDKVVLTTEAKSRSEAWWGELKTNNEYQMFEPNLPISAIEKSSLPAQPDEYATYRQANLKFGVGSILFSRSYFWGNNERGFYPHEIYYKSPVLDFNFNTVEGFVQNTGALYRFRKARYDWFEIDPTWRYSYNLNKSSGTLKLRWKTQQDDFSVTAGKFVSQYNVDTPIAFDLNSLSTLLLKKNYVKIYEKEFINFSLQERISNAWAIRSSIEWARRYPLENSTNYYWINFQNNDYLPNAPDNKEIGATQFKTNDAFLVSFQVNYRPTLKKQYRNSIRMVDLSSSPLIIFKYRGGLSNILKTDMDFHTVELGITHNFPLSINTNFNYIAQVGTFFDSESMTFADFKHFNGNNNMISIGDVLTTHRLVGFYDNYVWGASKKFIDPFLYSTNGTYVDIMTMFGFRKFLISRLNIARKLALREEIFANYLYTANKHFNYAEFGYGIDGIARIFRLEFGYRLENGVFTKDGPVSSKLTPIIRISLNSRVRGGVTPEW
ncbi:DUF5686 family protein [Flectobacillus major]|uniref:DUF5686 family protein n=1 Tax=Flectobacillus major TaxID=103 RepID=UPI00041ACF04|nr:DUF5686 family protein [Flectobacillus major]